MYEFKITVSVPGLPEAINNLADALKGQHNAPPVAQSVSAVAAPAQDIPAANPTPAPVTAPVQQTEAAPSVAAPSEKVYTVDDLGRAGATLIDQGKMPQLLDLLSRYSVQAITQLDSSTYPAFAKDMMALGATF